MWNALRILAVVSVVAAVVGAPAAGWAAGKASPVPAQARWVWYPEGKAGRLDFPGQSRYFRIRFDLPAHLAGQPAAWVMTADDIGGAWINGHALPRKRTGWDHFETFSLDGKLQAGANVLAVEVQNASPGPAGLLGWVTVRTAKGPAVLAATGEAWKASQTADPGWQTPAFDDAAWKPARVLGPMGMGPWGNDISRSAAVALPRFTRSTDKPVTADDARRLIESDWLVQAGDDPCPERTLEEIAAARRLARRLQALARPGIAAPDFRPQLAELDTHEAAAKALPADENSPAAAELYLAVRRLKRAIALRNPLLDFQQVLLADTPAYAGVHESAHRNGYHYRSHPPGRLIVLDGLRPDAPVRDLIRPDWGYPMRMDLSFDAGRVVFSLKPSGEPSFRLYQVQLDGTGLTQLTNSPYDDMDPIYLSDGHIAFCTSRGNTYVRCLPPSASTVLARCDADGRNIRILSRNSEPDYTPSLLEDGRILYTRWEYTERPLWRLQKLWTINPDGTGEAVYWGNNSSYPDMLWEARGIAGTGRAVFAGVGHHNVVTGCLGILDIAQGLDWPHGIGKLTAELRWPECGDDKAANPLACQDYRPAGPAWSYRCPYPLGPEDFLVSVAATSQSGFDLYLMDLQGNRELIYAAVHNAWYPQPVRRRVRPPVLPDRVTWPAAGQEAAPGVLFSPNVYAGAAGLAPGSVRYLRVIQMDAKTYTMPFKSWRHSGPAISVIQEDGVKRILGTVPVEPDGSVAFEAPAGRALHFQLLDDQQRCLQVMRSFSGVMPGETRGCLGCHALHSASPDLRTPAAALRRPASRLAPPPWGAQTSVSYERFCQPVLDRHCGRCHQGQGKGRSKLDLTLRGGLAERGVADPALLPFKEPYLTLVGAGAWSAPAPEGRGAGYGLAGCLKVETAHRYGPLPAGSVLSSASPLIRWVTDGKHNGVKVAGEDLQRLIAWVDCNCVYRGDEEVRQIPDPDDKGRFPVPMRTRTAPVIDRLQPVTDPASTR